MMAIEAVQSYDLNIGVGQSQSIDVVGDSFRFISAVDPFAVIELRPNFSQGNITLKPGQGFRFGAQVQRWVVFNKGTVALTGIVQIGNGDFIDQRISGTVDVIDGGKARSLGNVAFSAFAYQAAVAAQYTRVQLWNPVASGKIAVIENVIGLASTTAVCIGHVRFNQAALATLSGYGNPKLGGGTASVMELRTDTTVTVSPNSAASAMLTIPQAQMAPFKPVEPLVLKPGNGAILWGTAGNADFGCTFEWYEEAAA